MTDAAVWAELGIDPTTDERAIRRAYSARLRTIDPEADPDAFMRLRAAYEAARHGVPMPADPPSRQPPVIPVPAVPPPPPTREAVPEPPPPAEPAEPGTRLDQEPFREIVAIFDPEREPRPSDPQRLRALTEQILADPALDSVENAREADSWLVEIIARNDDRGDAMLAPAIAHFGWDRDSERWDEHPIVAHLVDRNKGAEMIAYVSDPDGTFYPPYVELTTATGPVRARMVGKVVDLINLIRTDAPFAEAWLNADRVTAYVNYVQRSGIPNIPDMRDLLWPGIGFAIILIAGITLGQCQQSNRDTVNRLEEEFRAFRANAYKYRAPPPPLYPAPGTQPPK